MKSKTLIHPLVTTSLSVLLVALLCTAVAGAQETSRVIPFTNVATTLPPGGPQDVTIQVWDAAAAGNLVFSEAQPGLAVDASGNISFVLGSRTPGPPAGLDPNNFPTGSSRYLDVVDSTNTSVLAARVPLTATAFALSPGPQGPPGVVQSVTAGDSSVVIGGTPAAPTVVVADGGISAPKLATGAVGPAQIAGGAVTSVALAPNAVTAPNIAAAAITGTNIAVPLLVSGSVGPEQNVGVIDVSNSGGGWGVVGQSSGSGAIGVLGNSPSGEGVVGNSSNGVGVHGASLFGLAGRFDGTVQLNGAVTVANVVQLNNIGCAAGIGVVAPLNCSNYMLVGQTNGSTFINSSGAGAIHFRHNNNEADQMTILTNGTTAVRVLTILGGADVAERFEVSAPESADETRKNGIEAGMVVSIDPNRPGALMLSDRAYDHRIAGVISGAGGVNAGMLMGQSGTLADGGQPIAVAGRVYCWADASNGPIQPGDLLTTSATRGHAMKVTNHAKAQGAVIGKALTGLRSGEGLILVLVTLR